MQHSAATQSQIDATLADKLCLVRLDPTSTIALESDTNSAISPTVSVYYDNQAKDYYVIGSWNWNRNDWANDLNENGCLNACTKNDGQPDGWAIATNQPVVVQGESSSWWGGWYFGQSVSSAATTVNQNGAGFKVQDTARWSVTNGWDYNMLHGEEVFDFYHLVNGCTSYFQPFFTYGHTWSSTSITGFSISNSGASISFSSSSNGWQRAVSGNYISAC